MSQLEAGVISEEEAEASMAKHLGTIETMNTAKTEAELLEFQNQLAYEKTEEGKAARAELTAKELEIAEKQVENQMEIINENVNERMDAEFAGEQIERDELGVATEAATNQLTDAIDNNTALQEDKGEDKGQNNVTVVDSSSKSQINTSTVVTNTLSVDASDMVAARLNFVIPGLSHAQTYQNLH